MSFTNNTGHKLTNTMEQTIVRYADKLEDATNFSITLNFDTEEEEYQIYLIDPCGDAEGDPWTDWNDFVSDTEPVIARALN